MITRYLIIFAAFLSIATNVSAQKISAESMKVQAAYQAYKKYALDKTYQLAYINAFPSDAKSFKAIFDPDDFKQLYDGHDYIDDFIALSKYYPDKVLNKAIDIGKDLTWDADAINYLQVGIMKMSTKYLQLFIIKLKTLNTRETTKLINYLAVQENGKYPEYDMLISNLKKRGESNVAKQFIRIRAKEVKKQEIH